jgi:disulfide bond formation protein DsbB
VQTRAPLTYDRGVQYSPRLLNFAGFFACAALMGYALYAQHVLGLDPCPLCIFQRVGIIALGIVFLVAALHNPKRWGAYIYGALIALAALATIGVAARHLYVQSLPSGSVPACGAPLNVLLQFTPILEVIRKVLIGGGECQEVNWRFLGLAMPAWVLICALALGAGGVLANLRGVFRGRGASTGAPELAQR